MNVYLKIDGKWKGHYVHRLVAMMFCPDGMKNWKDKNMQVDHIDGDRANNVLSNLRWLTRKENNSTPLARANKSGKRKAKMKNSMIRATKGDEVLWFYNANQLKDYLGCSHVLITYALQGKINHVFGWTVERFRRDDDEVQSDENALDLLRQEEEVKDVKKKEFRERENKKKRELYRQMIEASGRKVREYRRKSNEG